MVLIGNTENIEKFKYNTTNISYDKEILLTEHSLSFVTRKIIDRILSNTDSNYIIVLPSPDSTIGLFSSKYLKYLDISYKSNKNNEAVEEQHLKDLRAIASQDYTFQEWKLNVLTLMNMLDIQSKFYCQQNCKDIVNIILDLEYKDRIIFY